MNFYKRNFELIFWIAALITTALIPLDASPHYSFCLFKLAGFDFCPGCGIGHSISYLFHGNLSASFNSHPLGLFAVLVIICRISKLLRLNFFHLIKICHVKREQRVIKPGIFKIPL
jgi:hypothetical protein